MGKQIRESGITQRAICEVLLRSYKELDKRVKRIAKMSVVVGLRSRCKDVYESCDELFRLHNEQVAYINVKVIMGQALDKLESKNELIEFFINEKPYKAISEELNASINAVAHKIFRQKNKLFKLILEQYSVAELLDYIGDSKWLIKEFNRQLIRGKNESNKSISTERSNGH